MITSFKSNKSYKICNYSSRLRVYMETKSQCEGPFTVTNVSQNIISVNDGTKLKPFNISSVLPIERKTTDVILTYDREKVQAYVSINDQLEYNVELLKIWDPRTKTEAFNDEMKERLQEYQKEELSKYAFKERLAEKK